MKEPQDQLRELLDEGLLRRIRTLDSRPDSQVVREGKSLWNFASNDYLGLASHDGIRDAYHEGLDRWGHGATASRLITGSQTPHRAFEESLSHAKGSESALLFSSGFSMATGVIPALVGKGDFVILDKLSHACLIDGARLSKATIRVFPHNDTNRLEALVGKTREKHPDAGVLILTESVFSMDGDLCPLAEILRVKHRYGAMLLLDEAHGFGVLGPNGMGLAEQCGVQDQIDFQMGTLGKAAGLSGAYLACNSAWRDLLINRARSFIYSTAPSPALAHAARHSLSVITSEEGNCRRERLAALAGQLAPNGTGTAIIPRILGSNEAAIQAAADLEEAGFLIPAIRYPTVPRGTARLRISLSATHPDEAIQQLSDQLETMP